MPATARPQRRATAWLAIMPLVLVAGLFTPVGAQTGFEVPVSRFHEPTWGTNRIEGSPTAGLVWDIVVHDHMAYIAGAFTALTPTIELAGALDGVSGLPLPGFPKIEAGEVKVAVPDGEGGWYLGGSFQKINDETRHGLARVHADGSVDPRWNPSLAGPRQGDFTVWALARDGPHVYIGGEFTKFTRTDLAAASTRNRIARVSAATGTVDGVWDPDADGTVRSIAVSPGSDAVYLAGDFRSLKGGTLPRPGLAAVTALGDGQPLEWQPPVGDVHALAVSPDGRRVYLGGDRLAAADPDGRVLWDLPGGTVKSLAVSPNGSVLYAGGDFGSLGGQPHGRLAAVDAATGAVDPAWKPQANGSVATVTVSDDGTKLYVGGTFDRVHNEQRNNLAALNSRTGALTPWNPNANGAVNALSASGSQVYAGGKFGELGAQTRTMLGAIDMRTGKITGWASRVESLGSDGSPRDKATVVQALALSEDRSRVFIGGNFTHVNGVPRKHLAAVSTRTGEVDDDFRPAELMGTVRALAVRGNTLYVGGDFKSVRVSGSQHGTNRPDNPCPQGRPDCAAHGPKGTSSTWSRGGLITAFDATTGVLDFDFHRTPESVGPGLIGQAGKRCKPGSAGCGNGAVRAIALSPDGRYLYAAGTFSDLGGQLGLISLNRGDGSPTSWQPEMTVPIFGLDVFKGDGKRLLTAGGGPGGRIQQFLPHEGPTQPLWEHIVDGDAMAVQSSPTAIYVGGHFDWVKVDHGTYRRKHAAAFAPDGEIAQNFDPELDTNTGPFTIEVTGTHVIYGGEFARVNRRPQPGYAQFPGTP